MPDHDFKSPRLFVEADLREGAPVAATQDQANYLLNVMRLDETSPLLVFNGRDGEWRARVEKVSKKKADLVPLERVREQPPAPDLVYLFAPLKHARLDYMVQKAVEMGAAVLQPVLTQHVQMPKIRADKMRANAIEAAEQCGILSVPECREMIRLDVLLRTWDPDRSLVFCDERAASASPLETLRSLKGGRLALLIGPEGGFSEAERAALAAQGFVCPISLGPRILRADTAAVAALALLQATAGDWNGSSSRG